MAFDPEHPKWDQNPKFTPLRETTSIPAPFIWESPPLPSGCNNAVVPLLSELLVIQYLVPAEYAAQILLMNK